MTLEPFVVLRDDAVKWLSRVDAAGAKGLIAPGIVDLKFETPVGEPLFLECCVENDPGVSLGASLDLRL
jgi:hypothetical protein